MGSVGGILELETGRILGETDMDLAGQTGVTLRKNCVVAKGGARIDSLEISLRRRKYTRYRLGKGSGGGGNSLSSLVDDY